MVQQVGFLPTLPSLLTQPEAPFIHRDLSWLQFNERVLAEARQSSNPLLERAKFLSISASNLDEFFMIRLSSLARSIQTVNRSDPSAGRWLMRVRASILENVAKFTAKQSEAFDLLMGELEPEGIRLVRQPREDDAAFALGKRIFDEQILPKLGPPEPFTVGKLTQLENLQIGATFAMKGGSLWFRIPRAIAPVLLARGGQPGGEEPHLFFLDDLLASHLGAAFRLPAVPGFFRLARDGDLTIDLEEEDTESIPDVVRTGLRTRDKGRAVRLQYQGEVSEELLRHSVRFLKIVPGQIQPTPYTMCLHGLWSGVKQLPEEVAGKPGMAHPPLQSRVPKVLLQHPSIFEELKRRDVLLHHPYDSFDAFVAWVRAACNDPNVVTIEQTVYRMDALSPVIQALKDAAKLKKVRVVIELRARFDELNNLALADDLRKAGVEVAFGFGKLKLHAKIALVTRQEGETTRLYTHLSTGNYNAQTSRQYTDLAILTANQEVGADARHFFDKVLVGEVPTSFKQLVSAPAKLHKLLISHIQTETEAARALSGAASGAAPALHVVPGAKPRIVAKVNALVDAEVIEHLYRASQAGVQVDLIVRGACSLIPGVKGLSDNIRVISVVDRFLEHSRIYWFGSSRKIYLSSADWMPRNFFSRLEVAFPVLDPHIYRYLEEVVVPAYLADSVKARELTPQGTWKKRSLSAQRQTGAVPGGFSFGKKAVRSQFLFEELAAREYKGTPLE